jgi:hypothetical protein
MISGHFFRCRPPAMLQSNDQDRLSSKSGNISKMIRAQTGKDGPLQLVRMLDLIRYFDDYVLPPWQILEFATHFERHFGILGGARGIRGSFSQIN